MCICFSEHSFNDKDKSYISYIKGTVRVMSSNPPYKDGNVRFTTVPLKAFFDQV